MSDINTRGILALVVVTILAILFTLAYERWKGGRSRQTSRNPGSLCGCGNSQACRGSRANEVLLPLLPTGDKVPAEVGERPGTGSRYPVRPDLLGVSGILLDWVGPERISFLERCGLRKDWHYDLFWDGDKYILKPLGRTYPYIEGGRNAPKTPNQ